MRLSPHEQVLLETRQHGIVLAGSYKNAAHGGKIFRSTDYGQT